MGVIASLFLACILIYINFSLIRFIRQCLSIMNLSKGVHMVRSGAVGLGSACTESHKHQTTTKRQFTDYINIRNSSNYINHAQNPPFARSLLISPPDTNTMFSPQSQSTSRQAGNLTWDDVERELFLPGNDLRISTRWDGKVIVRDAAPTLFSNRIGRGIIYAGF